jgi:ornithine cyclodeaminase/alanine dehydrogenase-like protein (mu-crystallin family)
MILYLCDREVARALEEIDAVDAVSSALVAHAQGETVLPLEAHLAWNHAGERVRSLSMPALVEGCAGVKIINGNPVNPARGLPRASGLTVLMDVQDGRPICVMEAARISCLRTAAVTALSADLFGAHPIERVAILGAGALARCHFQLLPRRLPRLREIRLFDVEPARAAALAARAADTVVAQSAEQAIRGAQLIVAVTTTMSGYIRMEWLESGSLLSNVSLDDPLPEVVLHVDKVFVDDWTLVSADERRLLGRMFHRGEICGPDAPPAAAPERCRRIDGELGDVLIGAREGRSKPDEAILVNPFGLAIEDIAVARRVYERASALGLGKAIER